MTELGVQLPEELSERIVRGSVGPDVVGRLGNSLTRVVDKDRGPAFLKVGTGAAGEDLRCEAVRLQWIGARLPVPEVIYLHDADPAFLLITELKGSPSHEWLSELGPQAVVESLAQTLRDIHALEKADCPFTGLFAAELAEAEERLRAGSVDETDFTATTGMAPADAIAWLKAAEPGGDGTHVFTHGDYCMPNVLMSEGQVSGIVDWGLSGLSKPHRDFTSFEVTLRLNLDMAWNGPFYAAYGLEEPDREFIRFYSVLNQFF